MRAIYNCAFADPWIAVAEKLRDRHGIEPVYWIGYEDDDSRKRVAKRFPDALYHPYFDAWKGVFPEGVEDEATGYPLEPDVYRSLGEYELQALHLMDRMDFDGRSFSYPERRQLFRKIFRCWRRVIHRYRIEALISPSVPHRSFDYPLYLACREKGIPMISYLSTPFSKAGRIIPVSDPYTIPEQIRESFERTSGFLPLELLSEDIREGLNRTLGRYQEARPESFRALYRHHRKKPSFWMTGRKFLAEAAKGNSPWLGRGGWLVNGVPSYHKESGKNVELACTRIHFFPYILKILRRIKSLKRLAAEYRTLSVVPDLSKKYVLLALHYQPEATTSPKAGIFVDQLYLLELMSAYLPPDWQIYVKENPMQFNPVAEGNTGRPLRFYRDALKIPRVTLVKTDSDPFTLIDRAQAVFSVAGTIGWEGMARGKAVVCFGPAWYEHFTQGVLRVRTADDLRGAASFIDRYRYDRGALTRYLKVIEEHSVCAFFRRGLQQLMNMDLERCVDNLASSVALRFGLEADASH